MNTITKFEVGQNASLSKSIMETDVYMIAEITGDYNPLHLDSEYAKKTLFKERIAHGVLSFGLISAVIGTKLPGKGTIYLNQNIKFIAPVYIGETITATVIISEIIPEKNKIILHTYCTNQDGKIVLDGEAMVMPPTL